MNDWFTIEKKDESTYAISEYKHWEETHCYLLIGTKKNLLIDTGLGVSDIKAVVDKLTDLPVEVVTTHVHWDHIGGHKYFENIAVFETEKKWLSEKIPIPLQAVKQYLTEKPCDFPFDFIIEQYKVFQSEPKTVLHDNDCIDLGDRVVHVLHTPGHSPGHICLYEPERGYLFTGDLIYEGVLDAFYPSTNPLDFMKSVERIGKLSLDRIFPGHHKLNISVGLVAEIYNGFLEIQKAGKLKQGGGLFEFEHFGIHI